MDDLALSVRGLGKRYRLSGPRAPYKTLRESISRLAMAPFRAERERRARERVGDGFLWALRDVSFDVRRGEVVGIIGRNGAGKTTLLKILSRITEPTEGRAEVHGRVGSLLEIGTGFHPELTGRENIYLNGAILGMRKAEIDQRFEEIVEFAEIEKFLDLPVKRYSSGMYLRLAFAVAAHLEPDILVVDEVLAVGDAEFQKKCIGKMESVSMEGRTVLFVSHNIPAVARLCSRGILLDRGQVKMMGPVEQVVGAYTQGVLDSGGVRSWDETSAPGQGGLKLLSVSVTDGEGNPSPVVSVETSVRVTLRYRISVPNLRFRCAAGFHTQGTDAFTVIEPSEIVRARPGVYTTSVTVPPHLLAEGEYRVGVSMFTSRGIKHRYVQAGDALSFQVYDPMNGSSARGDFAGRLSGVVQPRLPWATRLEGGEEV